MPKVLVLREGRHCDFLADMVWINLAIEKKINLFCNSYPSFLFDTKGVYSSNIKYAHGSGFTLYGKLKKSEFIDCCVSDYEVVFDAYDYVIYPSIRKFDKYFWRCLERFGGEKVIAIDGDDDECISWHSKYCLYFKRETSSIAYSSGINPIQCFLPKIILENIKNQTKEFTSKKYLLAPCDPRDRSTFIYKKEKDYFQQYKESFFAYTEMRGGAEALRHYEIIASGAVPYFGDIKLVPKYCLHNYPKNLQLEANNLYEQVKNKLINEEDFKSKYYKIQSSFYNWIIEHGEIYGSKLFYEKLINKVSNKKKKFLDDQKLFWINYHAYKKIHNRYKPSRFNSIKFIFNLKVFLFTFYCLINSRIKEQWYKKMRKLN